MNNEIEFWNSPFVRSVSSYQLPRNAVTRYYVRNTYRRTTPNFMQFHRLFLVDYKWPYISLAGHHFQLRHFPCRVGNLVSIAKLHGFMLFATHFKYWLSLRYDTYPSMWIFNIEYGSVAFNYYRYCMSDMLNLLEFIYLLYYWI